MPPFFQQQGPGSPLQRGFMVERVGFGPGHGFFLLLLIVLLVGAAFLIASALTRRRTHHTHGDTGSPAASASASRGSDALRILDERFARGEIDTDDYTTRRDLLAGHA